MSARRPPAERPPEAVGEVVHDPGQARERLGLPVGECLGCRWARLVSSRTSTFLRCGLSDLDREFPRYPELPVHGCPGFEPRGNDDAGER